MKRIGVLLAAGGSERMGRPKQLLPWPPKGSVPISGSGEMGTDPLLVPSKPLVAAAFDAIAPVCDAMVVVIRHHADEVVVALGDRKFHRADGETGHELFASIRQGLLAAERLDSSADIVLHPADHPLVRRDTLDCLLRIGRENPGRAHLPTYRGQGGHPVLIPAAIVTDILAYSGHGGLRQYWIDRPQHCVRVPTDDAGVVFDVDTQLDYDLGVQ